MTTGIVFTPDEGFIIIAVALAFILFFVVVAAFQRGLREYVKTLDILRLMIRTSIEKGLVVSMAVWSMAICSLALVIVYVVIV